MIAILAALAPLFLITALGYALAHLKFGGAEMWHALDHITFYVFFPALLVKTLMRADLASVPAGGFFLVSSGSVTIMSGALLAGYLILERPLPDPAFTSFFQGAVRFQSTIVVAVAAALYGERGLTFAALSVASIVPTAQLYTVLTLLIFGKGNGEAPPWSILKRLATNPLTLACALGLALNATGCPSFVYETFSVLGAAAIALTLLAVGAGLDIAAAHAARNLVAMNMALRLLGMPALVFGLCWLAGLSGLARTIAVIAAAVPTAPTAYTIARKMGGDAELMAQIITFQSIASLATLPLFIWLAQSS
ncbi:MAG: AEC family transporter [Rhodomicrobium sp.]